MSGTRITGVPPSSATEPEPPRSRRRLLVVLVAALVALAAGTFLLLRPTEATEPEEPEPGATVTIEPRNINLADGYLRLGFAIELAADVEEIATARAIDSAITLFSGRTVAEVNDPERRAELKSQLTAELVEAYDGEVLAVYFTDFVTQ